MGHQVNHYHELPGWAETQPDPVVRDVPTNPKAFDGEEGGPPGGGGSAAASSTGAAGGAGAARATTRVRSWTESFTNPAGIEGARSLQMNARIKNHMAEAISQPKNRRPASECGQLGSM